MGTGRCHGELAHGAVETLEVRHVVDRPAVPDADDFVDTVGELVAAVLHVNHGLGVRQVTAVDVSDMRHLSLVPLAQKYSSRTENSFSTFFTASLPANRMTR